MIHRKVSNGVIISLLEKLNRVILKVHRVRGPATCTHSGLDARARTTDAMDLEITSPDRSSAV